MLEVNNFDAIRISLASPEQIRAGRRARSPSRRRSTTARSSRRRTASSASASSVRPRTGSATAASTSASATRASSATSAASRSRAPRCAASGWATSSWPRRSATSGSSRARRAGSACCSTSPRATWSGSSTSPCTSSPRVDEDEREKALARIDEEMTERIARAAGVVDEKRAELEGAIADKRAELEAALRGRHPPPRRALRRPLRGAGHRRPAGRGQPQGGRQDGRRGHRVRPDRRGGGRAPARPSKEALTALRRRGARPRSRRVDERGQAGQGRGQGALRPGDRRPDRRASTRRSPPSASRSRARPMTPAWRRAPHGQQLADIKVMQTLTESEYRDLGEQYGRHVQGRHGRRGGPEDHRGARPGRARPEAAHRDAADLRPAAQEGDQAAARGRGVPQERQPAGVDDPDHPAGHPARPAPDGAARRRPLRDLRPERPVPPRHQPQQPPHAAARPRGAGDHHPQREADAAGGVRRADRQRPARPRRRRHRQPQAQEPVATCSRASRAASARTCSASASTTPAARSSWSARS